MPCRARFLGKALTHLPRRSFGQPHSESRHRFRHLPDRGGAAHARALGGVILFGVDLDQTARAGRCRARRDLASIRRRIGDAIEHAYMRMTSAERRVELVARASGFVEGPLDDSISRSSRSAA